jgi:hypothetical protein
MRHHDESDARRQRSGGRWQGMSQRSHNLHRLGRRGHLRLVVNRRRENQLFGMHPSLPATLVFAAVSITALAVASAIDVASSVARSALARLRASD